MKPVEPDREYPYPKLVDPDREYPYPKLVEPGREERATRVETPGTRTTNPTPSPGQSHHGFDTTHSLPLAGRLNQLRYFKPAEPDREYPYPKLVEPGREERATRVETPGTRTTNPTPSPGQSHHGFDTTHSLPLAGRLNQLRYFKPVEPDRDEGAARVETKVLPELLHPQDHPG